MKVLVIPEDPTYNGYILEPLIKRLIRSTRHATPQIFFPSRPYARGYAMVKAALPNFIENYRHMDLLLFLPDDDCESRTDELRAIEERAAARRVRLLACAAIPEVEAWLLAGHVDKLPDSWQTVRVDCDLKERYFEPFLRQYGDHSVGDGRKRLMLEALRHFDGMLARCPELQTLQQRIQEVLEREA